jgi:hypothetical protein
MSPEAAEEKKPRPPLGVRVETWLETTGYPLEYRAGRMLAGMGFGVGHSFFVPGEHEYNGLEIDVLGTRPREFTNLTVIVECKVVPPGSCWVALSDEIHQHRWSSAGIGRNNEALRFEHRHSKDFEGKDPVFKEPIAAQLRTMREGKRHEGEKDDDKDPAFKTMQSVTGRVISFIAERADSFDDRRLRMVVPVFVVDGDLTIAKWDTEKNRFKAAPTEMVWLEWGGHSRWESDYAMVAVVKIEAFEALADRLREWGDTWGTIVEQVVAAQPKRKTKEKFGVVSGRNVMKDEL